MKIKQKKGISLIVLVITIIVMIILATTIILALNGSGIIGKAGEAKTATNEAALLEAANLAAAEWDLEKNLGNAEEPKIDYIKTKLLKNGFTDVEINKVKISDNGVVYINEYDIIKVPVENVNLYNKEEMKIGYFQRGPKEGKNDNYMLTGYIPVNPGDKLYWSAYVPKYAAFDYQFITAYYHLQNVVYVAYFDENKNFIKEEQTGGRSFDSDNNNEPIPWEVPEGVSYVRFSFSTGNGKVKLADTLVICKNEPPKYYSEYMKAYAIVDYETYLPEEIDVCVGATFNIYNSNICLNSHWEELTFKWECDIGTSNSDGISFSPTSEDIGNYTAKVSVYNEDNKIVDGETIKINVVENTISKEQDILLIGDSLSNNKSWITDVETMSDGKIDIIESAISGASTQNYYTASTIANITNPFYNSEKGTFDYEYYIETNNASYDSVMVFLGTNDMNINGSYYPNRTLEDIKLKAIVDNIKSYDADLPIYLITPMTTVNKYYRIGTAYNFLKYFYSTFGTYNNVTIVPIELAVDMVNDFGTSDSIHPLTSGYTKIANVVYSALCANI